MGRRIRHFEPDGLYLVTNRCAGAKYLLTPSADTNRIIRGALARYASIYDVELFAWMFMGNHFHLIVRSESLEIPRFVGNMQQNISQEIQRTTRWNLRVFPRRYSAERILDTPTLWETINYVLMNPVRADLVAHPRDWPGVSSFELHDAGGTMEGRYLNRTKLGRLRRQADDTTQIEREQAMETFEVGWTAPPSASSKDEANEHILDDLDTRCEQEADRRRALGIDPLGAEGVQTQSIQASPEAPARSPEPLCHASDERQEEQYHEHHARVTDSYRQALDRWQQGRTDVSFPPGTYPPGWLEAIPIAPSEHTHASERIRGDPN